MSTTSLKQSSTSKATHKSPIDKIRFPTKHVHDKATSNNINLDNKQTTKKQETSNPETITNNGKQDNKVKQNEKGNNEERQKDPEWFSNLQTNFLYQGGKTTILLRQQETKSQDFDTQKSGAPSQFSSQSTTSKHFHPKPYQPFKPFKPSEQSTGDHNANNNDTPYLTGLTLL